MKYIRAGIAYEGGDDGRLIAEIVKRIIEPYDFTFDYFDPATPGTAIIDFIPSYTKRFIEADVHIGVFCTDQDEDEVSRRSIILDKIEKTDPAFLLKSAVGVPVPHIEAWLLMEDSIIKNFLGIDGTRPLPHGDLAPKDRLTALYSESTSYSRSPNDLRVDIVKNMDINRCSQRSADLKVFVEDIRRIISSI